jgi:hypothetical protein
MAHKTISKRTPVMRKPVRRKAGIAPKKQTTEPALSWLDAFHSKVSPAAWDQVPTDGARNLEHYLYGSPKH